MLFLPIKAVLETSRLKIDGDKRTWGGLSSPLFKNSFVRIRKTIN